MKHGSAMKIVLSILFLYSSSVLSNTIERALLQKTPKSKMIYQFDVLASSGIQEKVETFQSQDIIKINREFQKSLNKPSVLSANAKLMYKRKENEFSYLRNYFTLLELQNPVFPRLNIVQYNDHILSLGRNLKYKRASLKLEGQYVQRKYQQQIYELDQILSDEIDYDPEAGDSYNFYRANAYLDYQLNNSSSVFLSNQNLDSDQNPIEQSEYHFGIKGFLRLQGNIKLTNSFKFSSFPTWSNKFQMQYSFVKVSLDMNNFNDLNKTLSLTYKNFEINYQQLTFRNHQWANKSSLVDSISLHYQALHF